MAEDPMKIALFTDTYDQVNGVANTFRYLTDYCRKNDKPFDIFTHAADSDSVEESGSVRIFRYKPALPVDIYFDMIFDLKLPRFRVLKDFAAENYDLIHTATPGSIGLHALAAARLAKLPLIGTYHTSLPEYVHDRVDRIVQKLKLPTQHTGQRSENLTWAYMQWYYNQTELVLAPSEHTKALLETKLNTKVGIFSRGIDTERFHPRFRQDTNQVTVLYVGRVSTEKNLDILTDIFADREDAQLLIVGDGPYKDQMQQECPRARFAGFLKGRDLSQAYASADIFVFPSTTDTFGNVVLEAMSSGVPVIVTDKMGPRELVADGENGFIARDQDEFRQRLDLLIRDADQRRTMGTNARRYALSRSWDAVFDKLFENYRLTATQQT